MIDISVVIPTCNRKERVIFLLENLLLSTYKLKEVIIVDSGEDRFTSDELDKFTALNIKYINAEKSVCIQRNKGIKIACSEWIFVCDDDIEVPADYIEKIAAHIKQHANVVAISGLVLQKENDKWLGKYDLISTKDLLWKYLFKLSIWGEIKCKSNFISNKLKRYYNIKGNYISKAGWPIITDFSTDYFIAPAFGLGASVIKKEWLIKLTYDEVLDRHGIGDNYGLSLGFPPDSIHVINSAFVYHHQAEANRLKRNLQYYRRILALDYFRQTKPNLWSVKKRWLVWSLIGNTLMYTYKFDATMIKVNLKLIAVIIANKNPYLIALQKGEKVIEPKI